MKEWIVSYKMLHATAIEDRTLTFCKLANDLRKELLKSSMLRAGQVVAKGAFSPSFANSDHAEQPKDNEPKRKKTKGQGKQKMTIGELSAKCPTCRNYRHTLENCLYVFLEKAKRKFTL